MNTQDEHKILFSEYPKICKKHFPSPLVLKTVCVIPEPPSHEIGKITMAEINEHTTVDITIDRFDRIYRPKENVTGVVTISSKDAFSYPNISVNILGQAELKLESVSKDTIPPRSIIDQTLELKPMGKMAKQSVEKIPFSFPLVSTEGKPLLETYHGVYVNIMYVVGIELNRGKLKKKLEKEVEFIVEVPVR
jgi:hypothetical protein